MGNQKPLERDWTAEKWHSGRLEDGLRCQHRSYFSASIKLPLKWKIDFTLAKLWKENRFGSILNQTIRQK